MIYFLIKRMVFLLLLGFTLTQTVAWSKSADGYYHSAAAMYIEGRQQQAAIEIHEGLQKFPDDPKLKNLNELLKNLQNQQQQDNQQQQKQQQNQEEKEKQDDKQKDEQKQDKKEQEENTAEQDEQDESQKEPEDSTQTGEAEEVPEGEMSEEDAKRLLDAYKEDEKAEQEKIHSKKQRKTATDW